jgi:cell division protein FtsL
MVVCAVFSGSQTARTIFMGSNSAVPFSQSYGSSEVSPMQEVKLEARISEIPRHAMENAKLTSFDKLQLFSTLFAIIIGLILFLVFKFQSPSMQQQIEKIEAQMADAASGLMSGLTIG